MNRIVIFTLLIIQGIASPWSLAQEEMTLDNKTRMQGFVEIVYDESNGDVFIGIKRSQLNEPLLFQSSLPQGVGSNDIGLDRGQLGDTRLVQFERFGNKLMLKQLNTKYRAISDNALERASIDEAFADSVIAGFEIELEQNAMLYINYSNFLLSDIHGVSARLSRTGQGGYSLDSARSAVYLPKTKSFPKNSELEALITFAGSPKGQYIQDVTPDAKSVTVHMHHSFIELPDDNYQARKFHPFSGFWKQSYQDYSVPIDENMEQAFIPRHRLAKRDPAAQLSEAVEPIVYYLDPGIPEPVMTALKEGALWWNQAFEASGYKDAFQVKVLPADADPMDVRYNVIQWVHRATRGWSYGSSVVDPRTGEIIKGHVTLGSLRVRQDYLIALGMTSPLTSRNADTSAQKDMALDRIRQLSAHEVGHTLGIAHNFAASETGRSSVMDYPHPLFSIKQGKISMQDAYDKGIGEWDKYVVAYGYQDFTENESEQLLALVNGAKKAGFKYKSDPDARIPRRASADGHLWENGSDAIAEFKRVSEVRRLALDNFGINSLPYDLPFSDLEERLVPVYYSHRYQLDALVKQISGVEYTYSVKSEQTQDADYIVKPVSASKQQEAIMLIVDSLSADFLSLPENVLSLIPPKAYGSSRNRESMKSRMGIAFDPVTAAESIAGYTATILLEPIRLNRLAYQHAENKLIPSVEDMVALVFEKHIKISTSDPIKQRVRHVLLSVFFDVLADDNLAPEVRLGLQAELVEFERWLSKRKKSTRNQVMLKHLQQYWQSGQWPASFIIKTMPPGSPI